MPNRNELIIDLLTDAIDQLESCEQVLTEAKTVTAPATRITKLTAAIDFHEEALFALKNAKFTYNDGERIVNEKLTFDFYKTAAETEADKLALLNKLQPVSVGAFSTIASIFQTDFSPYAGIWRNAIITEINDILDPLTGGNNLDWSARSYADILSIRAELDNCTIGATYIDYACLAILNLTEFQPSERPDIAAALRSGMIANLKVFVGSTFDAGVISNYDLAAANLFVRDSGPVCLPTDLDCLTSKLIMPEAQALTAYAALTLALKQKLITAVNDIVGFNYTGRDTVGNAFPILLDDIDTPWDRPEVTARKLFEEVPFVYDRQAAAAEAERLAARGLNQALTEYNWILYGTNSARFMSLAIHAGGLPFTTTDLTGSTNVCNDEGIVGWCAVNRQDLNGQIDANRVFVLHNSVEETNPISAEDMRSDMRLLGYLLGNVLVRGTGISSVGSEDVYSVSVEELFGTPSEYLTQQQLEDLDIDPNIIPLTQILPSVSYAIFSNPLLVSRLETIASQLTTRFAIGDYVFTSGNSFADDHGFLIVDWDIATDCSSSNVIVPNIPVPYVADLPNQQVGTRRPFYCSRIPDPQRTDPQGNGQWYAHRWWYFVKVPDRMYINFNRLFYPDPITVP